LLQTFDKAKLSGTNLLLNFKTILIVYNGWVSFLNVNWIHVFMPNALVYQVWNVHFATIGSSNAPPIPPFNHLKSPLQLHLTLQNEQDHKIIKIRKVMPSNNYLGQKNTTMTKNIRRWRGRKRWSTYQWQATTARKTPQSPTTNMSYNNEKNTTKSTRMTRKSQRQWQWCRK